MKKKIDKLDKKILSILINDSRTPFTDIAKEMNVSSGTIQIRVKKMEDLGIIQGNSIIVDYSNLGYSFTSYLGITVEKSSEIPEIMEILRKIPNILVANITSGKYGILCKFVSKDTENAKNMIFKISDIKGVTSTESIISLEESINDRNRLLSHIFKI